MENDNKSFEDLLNDINNWVYHDQIEHDLRKILGITAVENKNLTNQNNKLNQDIINIQQLNAYLKDNHIFITNENNILKKKISNLYDEININKSILKRSKLKILELESTVSNDFLLQAKIKFFIELKQKYNNLILDKDLEIAQLKAQIINKNQSIK